MLFDFWERLCGSGKTVVGFKVETVLTLSLLSWEETVQVLEQGTSFYVLCVFLQYLEKCPGP